VIATEIGDAARADKITKALQLIAHAALGCVVVQSGYAAVRRVAFLSDAVNLS